MKNTIKGGAVLLAIALVTYIIRNTIKELNDVGGMDFADVTPVEYDR